MAGAGAASRLRQHIVKRAADASEHTIRGVEKNGRQLEARGQVDPAQASVEPDEQGGAAPAAVGYVPIEIGDVVPTEHKYEYLSIRVENVPLGAKLSAGEDNGDESWSLTVADLKNLVYIPSRKGVDERNLIVRIVGVKGGFGEAVKSVEVPIGPADLVQGTYEAPAAGSSMFGAGGGMAAAFQAEIDAEVARQLATQKGAWQKELQRRLAEQAQAHEEALGAGANMERTAEAESLIAEAEARVQAAEAAAQEAHEAMVQALARAESAEAEAASLGMNEEAETLREQLMAVRRELSGVRASMRVRSGSVEEIQKEVHDSLQDEFAHQLEELHERYGRELERLTKLATSATASVPAPPLAADGGEIQARLAEARRQWEQEIAAKLASVESATKKAILEGREAAVAQARQQWEQEFQGRLAEAQAEWQESQLGGAPDPAPQVDTDALVKQAIAARDKQWQAEFERRMSKEREAWQAAQPAPAAGIDEDEVARRIEAARQEWETSQPAPAAGVDEDEVANRIEIARQEWEASQPEPVGGVDEEELVRRMEAARQEWLEAQNSLIEMRDREWQAELDRRVSEEHEQLVAAQAAIATAGTGEGDPEALAAIQQEWAQSQTLEIERRLLEAEEAWAAKDEERLQAARQSWEAEQQQMLAERDEKWKLEIVRQLDEARHAWKQGVEDHVPDLEMPVVTAGEAPVGVSPGTDEDPTVSAAPETAVSDVVADQSSMLIGEEEVVLDEEVPSFFEEHPEETFADRELGLQGRRDLPEEDEDDGSDDIVPEWMEIWADKLRIPPHWVPPAHRFGRRVKRLSRSAWRKLRDLVAGQIAARRAAAESKKANAAQPGGQPADAATTMAAAGIAVAPAGRRGFRQTKLYRLLLKAGQLTSRLARALLRLVGAVLFRVFRLALIAGVIALLYHGYYWVKPKVYPQVEPYIASYWDPYVGPYIRVYWDPYVQPYIDTYWGGYAKPQIVKTWNTYVEPYTDSAWTTTKSLANDALDGIMGLLPDAPPPPKVGGAVSKGKSAAASAPKPAPGSPPKLTGVAQRLYLTQPVVTLRADANKYSAAVGTVRQSDHIQRLGMNGGWVKIRVVANKMKVGWVPGGLLSEAPVGK